MILLNGHLNGPLEASRPEKEELSRLAGMSLGARLRLCAVWHAQKLGISNELVIALF